MENKYPYLLGFCLSFLCPGSLFCSSAAHPSRSDEGGREGISKTHVSCTLRRCGLLGELLYTQVGTWVAYFLDLFLLSFVIIFSPLEERARANVGMFTVYTK